MEIVFNNFSGGLNNILRPVKIGKNQAQLFNNIDTLNGTIKPTNKDVSIGPIAPYRLVNFNEIGVPAEISDTDNIVSQWGKYYTKDKIYYIDGCIIKDSPFNIGAPVAGEFITTVNDISPDNINYLKGKVYGLIEDSSGTKISNSLIEKSVDQITFSSINIQEAIKANAPVVYGLDQNGMELIGNFKEVFNSNMPYNIALSKYAHESSQALAFFNYKLADSSYKLNMKYEPISYSVVYTKDGVKRDVTWIDEFGSSINIDEAILTNAKIVVNADGGSITTGYARSNIVENIPFCTGEALTNTGGPSGSYTLAKFTFSKQVSVPGYTSVDASEWKSFVKYDETDYDATDYHTYAITFYNSKTGQETPPVYGTPTKVHPAELGTNVKFTSIPYANGEYRDFTKARIYRVSGPYKTFRFVKEVDVAKDGDKLVVELTENIINSDLTYICPTTEFVTKPNLEDIVFHANRIFGYSGNTLYFTLTDNPYSWSEFATIYVDGAIKAIQTTSRGLLILTNSYKAYVVTGTNKNTFVLRKIADNIGYTDGIISIKGNAYWIYDRDVYVSNGSNISNISKNRFELPNEPLVSVNVLNEDIYLVYASLVYMVRNGSLVKLNRAGIQDTVIVDSKLRYFKGGEEFILNGDIYKDEFEYISPDIYATTISEVKEFNKIFLVSEGTVTIEVLIDNNQVTQKTFYNSSITTDTIMLPVSNNKGHLLKVKLSGTGEVYEYKIIVVGVTDGR